MKNYCEYCKKSYTRNYNLKIHMKHFHPTLFTQLEKSKAVRTRNGQKCPLCNFSSNVRSSVEKHLRDFHAVEEVSSCKILYFLTKNEFYKWKLDLERRTNAVFVQPCGVQVTNHVTTTYYYCNRSGVFSPQGERRRALRLKGSSKINCVCPAKIKLIEKVNEGVEVHFTDTHLGHENEPHHINIPKQIRDEIAKKISQDVPFDSILNEIRQTADCEGKAERLKLITRKDLWNIKSSYERCKFNSSLECENFDGTVPDKFEASEDKPEIDISCDNSAVYKVDDSVELENYIIESDDLSDIKNYLLEKFTNILNLVTNADDLKEIENFLNDMLESCALKSRSKEHRHP